MKLSFWRLMAGLDDLLHLVDNIQCLDWLTGSEWRFRFCQWSQLHLFNEEERRGLL